jgi:hypothetical protein
MLQSRVQGKMPRKISRLRETVESGPRILSSFLGRNEGDLGGGGIKIGEYSGELLEKIFSHISLYFDSGEYSGGLLEML